MVENVLRLAVEPWRGRTRKPHRNDHDLVGVRIDRRQTDLRIAVKKAGGIWRPEAETAGGILARGANPRHWVVAG